MAATLPISRTRGRAAVLLLVACVLATLAPHARARELTLDERVATQKAIEQVYWNHRIWPKENPGPKPSLSEVMPDAAIRARVEASLRASALLNSFWHRPLSGEQVQAEIDRIVRGTKAPETLRDVFAALDDDPFLIAECLARPALAARLVESAYAGDDRIHGARRRALAAKVPDALDLAAFDRLDGDRAEITLVRDDAMSLDSPDPKNGTVHLAPEEWDAEIARIEGDLGRLVDRGDRFVALTVRARGASSITVASRSWTKRPYDDWVREATTESSMLDALDASAIVPPAQGYSVGEPLQGCTDDTWSATSFSGIPSKRYSHAVVWTGSEMIVWGGRTRDLNPFRWNTGGRYNPSTDTWVVSSLNGGTGANVPEARTDHTAVWTGTEMIVWGGSNGCQGNCVAALNTGGRYNPATDSWAASSLTQGTGANVPGPRTDHTAVWTGTEMIIWGGIRVSDRLNTGGRYRPSTDSWAASSLSVGYCPSARSNHSAVWTGTEMIVWGGVPSAVAATAMATGGRYNPASDSWVASSLTLGSGANVAGPRQLHTAVWTGSEMIVWGGFDGYSFLNTGGRYNPSTDTWAPSSLITGSGANVPSGRNIHTAVWSGSEMIVWGGSAVSGLLLNTGGRYDPATDAWAASSLTTGSGANVPAARQEHTAIWTGSEMIVWGGWGGASGSGGWSDGGRYDPLTDSWAVPPVVPAPRYWHTAVWTGSEMIVWGGAGLDGSAMKTGAKYDPATDSWVASSLTDGSGANVPPARAHHTAIWTGTEMIVWGGAGKTGGRYNPATDSWAASSLVTGSGANVPSRRTEHTAIWTGTEMIVWGGDDFGSLRNGGRYKPSTDSWAASSLNTGSGANVPAPLQEHTAVWTGSEMIVWGGSGDPESNTGGRFNPTTDTWAATSLTNGSGTNVPIPRHLHTAVWTGSEMIVWGGYRYGATGGPTKTGGRFNPSTDSWAASTLTTGSGVNVATSRASQTAVWTGSEMIVWGGYDSSSSLKTGGRYDPSADLWRASSLTMGTGATVPSPRSYQSAVWTGSRMIIWGGNSFDSSGGLYCAIGGCTANTWFRDSDGDGYGMPSVAVQACVQPPGYVAAAGDCQDGNSNVHADAVEACNGVDEDCDGIVDVAAETAGLIWADKTSLAWTASPHTTSYAVYEGSAATLDELGSSLADSCVVARTADTSTGNILDGTPPSGDLRWYLVRPSNACGEGSAGNRSAGPRIQDNSCDDGNPCTDDSGCPGSGCIHTNNTNACDAGNVCVVATCTDGACVSGPPESCDDGIACTIDSCDLTLGCIHAVACDDGNVCTTDMCTPSGCAHANNTASCDDGSVCTSGDVCQGGTCSGFYPGAATHLVISQLQTEGDGPQFTVDEFVEIYNPTSSAISLNGYTLQYKSTVAQPYQVYLFGAAAGSVPPHGWFLVANTGYNGSVPPDQNFNNTIGLVNTGGNLFLVQGESSLVGSCPPTGLTNVIDQVSYGGGGCPEGSAASPPAGPNNSIARKPGGGCGNGADSNSNALDFTSRIPSLPHNRSSTPEP